MRIPSRLTTGGLLLATLVSHQAIAADFVAGQLIVKYSPGAAAQSDQEFETGRSLSGGEVLRQLRAVPAAKRLPTQASSQAGQATLKALERIRQLPGVEYADLDYIIQPMATPADPLLGQQWNLQQIAMSTAWDISTGLNSPVVAVLDTGKTAHPDLAGRWVTGYDFISNSTTAKDGNGRDNDPTDPGDSGTCGGSYYGNSWHGTHVAGILGANTNNGMGIAGINWNARIAPLRILGQCGGTTSDLVDAMRWAAGYRVAGVPSNPTPAKVLNLSLGAYTGAPCTSTVQNAINAVVSKGATVVVAAGNENSDASGAMPANCNNVVAVAAVRRDGARAWYSNYGSKISLSAPGGEYNDMNTLANGIISTALDASGSSYIYPYYQGTSSATPHVAGVVSLMYARSPKIAPSTVASLLKQSATPLASGACPQGCGAGILNAEAALRATTP